jgi:hypothetical protein
MGFMGLGIACLLGLPGEQTHQNYQDQDNQSQKIFPGHVMYSSPEKSFPTAYFVFRIA